jgi:hypothetical protein
MNLAVKFNLLKNTQPHYSYTPESCLENDNYKLYFDRTVLTDSHIQHNRPDYPSATRRHGNFAGVHTLLRILLSNNSAVLINIITGVSPPHFDFVVYYVLCQC